MKYYLINIVIVVLLSCGQIEEKIAPASTITNSIFTDAEKFIRISGLLGTVKLQFSKIYDIYD